MNIQYLEIDSSFRNRTQYPNPGQFAVDISQSGQKTNTTALDPISYSVPIKTYIPSALNFSGVATIPTTYTNDINTFILSVSSSALLSKTANYYRGVLFNFFQGSASLFNVIINTWDYLTSLPSITAPTYDQFRITFSNPQIVTYYPTVNKLTINTCTNFQQGLVFIPHGVASSQIYKNWYVHNETNNLYARILAYDGNNSCASISPQPTWNNIDTISIRRDLPTTFDRFGFGSTSTQVVLSPNSDKSSGSYNGYFLRITQTGGNQNMIRPIISYTGSPQYLATFATALPYGPLQYDTYELLPFVRDNFSPFVYTGTPVSQEVCYEIQLVNLIMPNVSLDQGGLLSSYPYLYIELQQGAGLLNNIYSNNPNSTRKLFRVPVTNDSNPNSTSFLTLDKCSMAKIIKFNPYSNLIFGVYLSDGRPWIPDQPDTVSPSVPNNFLQVSAIFSIKRL